MAWTTSGHPVSCAQGAKNRVIGCACRAQPPRPRTTDIGSATESGRGAGRLPDMQLRIVYRSTGAENRKVRPAYYSKDLCLASLLRSLEESGVAHEIVFLNDGPIPPERLALMRSAGEVVALPPAVDAPIRKIVMTGKGGSGAARSYLAALALVEDRRWPDSDVVYLAEDDYLYRKDAFAALGAALEQILDASYYALYATVEIPRADVFFVDGKPWPSAVTTTSTFGARIGALRSDRWIHRVAWFATPRVDQSICDAYQGVRPFRWSRIVGDVIVARRQPPEPARYRIRLGALQIALNLLAARSAFRPHLLVTPFTPLATHLEGPFLATGTDWEAVARDAEDWLTSRAARPGGTQVQRVR
jgi:hypothetical protein